MVSAGPRNKDQFYFRLCSDHVSIEAIPRTIIRINLAKLKGHRPGDWDVLIWTPHFVVLKNPNGHEITLRKDGRMIVRNASSESRARQLAAETMKWVLKGFLD